MAQHDYVIANGTGAAVRSDINGALAAIVSQNSGATTPATTYAYQFWADTTTGLLKIRNAANSAWITLFQLDGEWSTLAMENGTAAAPSIYFKDSGTDTGFYSPGADQVGISTGGVVRLTTSTTAFTGTLPWQGQNGTAAAPALSFSGDPNTGLYNVGADNIGVSTNGTLRFDVSTTAVTSTLPVVFPLGAVATPSVTFTGDLNTGIWSPAADTIAFSEGGAEAMRIDSSSRLLVGTSTARANFFNGSYSTQSQLETTSGSLGGFSIVSTQTTDIGGILILGKSNATSIGGNALVSSNNLIGTLAFNGNDGTEFVDAARIEAFVDGTPGANDMPGRLVFSTTADGASSPTERLRIANNGAWGLAGANYGSSGQVLTSNGSGSAPTWSTASSGAGTVQAWVNFNGTSTVAIRASGNVSSITDNGTGDYTVNFTTAMPDANYTATGSAKEFNGTTNSSVVFYPANQAYTATFQTGSFRLITATSTDTRYDAFAVCVAIFR